MALREEVLEDIDLLDHRFAHFAAQYLQLNYIFYDMIVHFSSYFPEKLKFKYNIFINYILILSGLNFSRFSFLKRTD